MPSASEVSQHNSPQDCWIIVHKNVYNATEFVLQHPGGAAAILQYAGADATASYEQVHRSDLIMETLPKTAHLGPLSSPSSSSSFATPRSQSQEASSKPPLSSILSTHDFESIAQRTATAKTWAFYSSAATDLITMKLNKKVFDRILLRPRVLVDVEKVDTRTKILGFETGVPFFVAPTAMARMIHEEGEVAVARGCVEEKVAQILSTNASFPLSQITTSTPPTSHPHFLQLYINRTRSKTTTLLSTARASGIKAIFLTVDAPIAGKRESDERTSLDPTIDIVRSDLSGATMASKDAKGGGMGRLMGSWVDSRLTWGDIPWVREASGGLPIVVKGIQSAADAREAVKWGVDGMVLSNHGGRCLDTSQPPIYILLELHKLCPEVFEKTEIYIDGGIRRGTDIFKALCLGATAVGVGRPYLYALNYGAEGVARVTAILKDELETTMKMCGVRSLAECHPGLVNTLAIDEMVPGTEGHPYIQWRSKI